MALHLKSAGAIVFRPEGEKIKYFLLYRQAHDHYRESWDFPKGLVDLKEDELTAAQREVREETGINDFNFLSGFREKIKFFFRDQGQLVLKEVIFYLAETKTEKANVSSEHNDYAWLEYEETKERLTHKNSKEILEKADRFLKQWTKQGRVIK